jgi:polar amino acid transport system substrate-binding protein
MKKNVLALLAVAGLLAGCTATTHPRAVGTPSANPPVPVGAQDPAQIPSAAAGADNSCGDPTASLRADGKTAAQIAGDPTMATVLKNGRLRVGVDQNTFLFGYRDPATGQIVGFDIDVASEVAKAIFGTAEGHVQLVAITSAQRIPYVQNGQVDLVADTMTINCARWQQVAFSTDYYDAGQRVLVPRASTAQSIDDLGGKRVCAAAGSTSIQNIATATSKPVPVAVNDWTDCLVMLQQGQVDAISTDDTILAGLAAQDPNTKLVGPSFTKEPYGMAIAPKSTDFVRFVNGVLDRMRADGTWARIYTKWLGTAAPAPPVPAYKG